MDPFDFEANWKNQGQKTATKKPFKVPFVIVTADRIAIKTREGQLTAYKGDIIAKGVEGEIYPIGKEIFAKTYNVNP